MGHVATGQQPGASVAAEFDRILRQRELRTLFQPIVDLVTGAVVGYEGLARGPEGSSLASPEALLAAAHNADQVVEFDWAARASACRAALEAGLDPEALLLLNIEPIALDSECPPDLWPVIERAFEQLRIVLEVTERSLDRDPGTLLDGIERQRSQVAGIALDDYGCDPATVSMLPLVSPNVIKLDRSVVGTEPDARMAHVISGVQEQVERSGGIVIAEGIQTQEHRARALSIGVELGQGFLFGHPQEPPQARRIEAPQRLERSAPLIVARPFEVLAGRTVGRAGADLLGAFMEDAALCANVSAPVLHVALLPTPELFDDNQRRRLAGLAEKGTFAAVLGPGLPPEPGEGIRGVGSRRAQPMIDEWAGVTVGPCSTVAVLARRVPERADVWEYGITHDRRLTIAATRSLIRLLGPPSPRFRFDF